MAAPGFPVEAARVFPEAQLAPLRPHLDLILQGSPQAGAAEQALRAAGPAGLQVLLQALDGERGEPARASRLRGAIERVARQRHADVSGLYWYTDLAEARQAARAERKPILSLRLLGRLDEELSCANSRFFRVALYADERLSRYLQNHYILHWSSERPAPRITIDYGDGRVLVRTITGNSIHYVLDADGQPIDALPGLYGAWGFQRKLMEIEGYALPLLFSSTEGRQPALRAMHRRLLDRLEASWASEFAAVGGNPQMYPAQPTAGPGGPGAYDAMPMAYSKAAVEAPLLRAVLPSPGVASIDGLPWARLAAYHVEEGRLDGRSRALMRAQNPFDWSASGEPRPLSEEAFAKLVAGFEKMLALESARNEFLFRASLLRWMLDAPRPPAFDDFNRRVYAELFLTPASDPWMGLMPAEAYSALDNGGVRR